MFLEYMLHVFSKKKTLDVEATTPLAGFSLFSLQMAHRIYVHKRLKYLNSIFFGFYCNFFLVGFHIVAAWLNL